MYGIGTGMFIGFAIHHLTWFFSGTWFNSIDVNNFFFVLTYQITLVLPIIYKGINDSYIVNIYKYYIYIYIQSLEMVTFESEIVSLHSIFY